MEEIKIFQKYKKQKKASKMNNKILIDSNKLFSVIETNYNYKDQRSLFNNCKFTNLSIRIKKIKDKPILKKKLRKNKFKQII